MKKSLLLIALAFAGFTAQAQFANLGFEGAVTPNPILGDRPAGWDFALKTTVHTTGSIEGNNYAEVRTEVDAVLAGIAGYPSDTIPGILAQEYSGTITNLPTSIDLYVRYAPAGDTAAILVSYYDTLAAGSSDDVLVAQAGGFFGVSFGSWTILNLTVNNINAGNVNFAEIIITPSAGAWITAPSVTFPDPKPGAKIDVDAIVFNTPSGISDISGRIIEVNVYPNPASDLINFATEEEGLSLQVFDLTGKLVLSGAMEKGKNTFHINQLENGSYIYMVKAENGVVVAKDKFIVVR